MSFFTRTLHRLRRAEGGFSLMETVVALAVLFVALLALARTAAVGFTDIANSRQREQANQIANQVLEQVRGLTYERVGQGLKTSDLAGDAAIVPCADGNYYLACATSDPEAEKIVQSTNPATDVPLVPHRSTYGTAQGYTTTYTASVYVTQAKSVPQTGAYRVTAVVSWNAIQRPGVKSSITTQSLLYTPEGTTDASTGSGTAPFFYGTGSIGRAPISITPNAGVSGGTGVTGLPAWDSMTEDLYGLETSVQQQTLTRAESKATLTGAHKVLSGIETTAGGDTAEAIADDDPATTTGGTSNPGSLMQSAVATNVSGGGNSLDVVAASGGGGTPCPSNQPTFTTINGFEHGKLTSQMGGTSFFPTSGVTAGVSVDSAIKRTGNYSLKVVGSGGAAYANGFLLGNQPITHMHVALRRAALPSADVPELIRMNVLSSTSYAMSFGYKQSSNRFQVRMRNASGVWQTPVVQASGSVVAGQWYVINLKWDTSGTTHRVDWQVDGVAQTQATLTGAAATNQLGYHLGSTQAATFTANYDDLLVGYNDADYPYAQGSVKMLVPNGSGTHNLGSAIYNSSGTQTNSSTWWQLMDEVPVTTADFIMQTSTSTTNYAEFTLEDTTDTCIRGVEAVLWSATANANKTNNGQLRIRRGGSDHIAWNFNLGPNLASSAVAIGLGNQNSIVPPTGATWTQAELNGATARVGYSNDASPQATFHAVTVQYYVPDAGEVAEGGAGTETGAAASTTSATAATPCGTPTQVDGRACAYAHEDYSTTGPPHLSAKLDLTGSGAGTAKIYKFSPSTAGGTSYVWGRRAAGTGGAGTVKQTVVRYPGTHEFGALPSLVSGPSGWLGYWVKYDAGTSAASVTAEAGIGSAAPTYAAAGTISYWNGTGYSSMTCPAEGAAIPVTAVNQVSGGFRAELTAELACGASSIFPVGATGTATRTESRATLGSPVSGTYTYKITNTSSSAVVADLTVSVDLGSLTATARYAP